MNESTIANCLPLRLGAVVGLLVLLAPIAFGQAAAPADAKAKARPASTTAPAPSDAGPISLPPAPNPAKKVEVTVQLDIAWDPKRLAITKDDLNSAADDLVGKLVANVGAHNLGGENVGGCRYGFNVRSEIINAPATAPASRPAIERAKKGWKTARFTVVFAQDLYPRLGTMGQAAEERDQAIQILSGDLVGWLTKLDEQSGQSKQLYETIKRTQKSREQRLARWSDIMKDLPRQIGNLRADQKGKEARLKAIEAKINEIRHEAERKVQGDLVADKLAQIVKLRKDELAEASAFKNEVVSREAKKLAVDDALRAKAQESQPRIREAEGKLLEAEIQLAQRREAVLAAAGGDLLTRLTSDQAMLSIDMDEMSAKGSAMQHEYQTVEAQTRDIEQDLDNFDKKLKDARPWAIIASPPPAVKEQ